VCDYWAEKRHMVARGGVMKIKIHEDFKRLIPPMADEERELLEASIIAEGCRDPLVVWKEKGILLDGHHRYYICNKHDIEFDYVELSFHNRDHAADWIDRNQLGRRNLTPDQYSYIRGRRFNRTKKTVGRPTILDQNEPIKGATAERIAKDHGVSQATIKRDGKYAEAVEKVKTVDPDIEDKVTAGTAPPKSTVIEAAKVVDDDPDKAKEILAGTNGKESGIHRRDVMDTSPEVRDEDIKEEDPRLYNLKRYWRQSSKKIRKQFMRWINENDS